MKIDSRSHIPIYLQIAEGIREAVAAGVYLPEEPLPSLRVLALDIQVNPNTVQRAYDELTRSGLIYSRRGKGVFVAKQGTVDARSHAEQTVRHCFGQGIRAGYAAGMSTNEVCHLFKKSIGDKAETEK